jgi:uncharacterized protein (DUF2132 family)
MSEETNYQNNPLHGVSLKNLLTEIVEHYGFDILAAYLSINCFKSNPSIESSIKFLKKTDWAREKVEAFYLYEFKNLPRASSEQFLLSPRDRIIPESETPGKPAELSLEDAEYVREQREKKSSEWDQQKKQSSSKGYAPKRDVDSSQKESNKGSSTTKDGKIDPWGNWKNKE